MRKNAGHKFSPLLFVKKTQTKKTPIYSAHTIIEYTIQ